MEKFGSLFIIMGLVLAAVGILMNFLPKGSFPRLPGDILIQRDGFTFYFPVVSSIVLSILLTLVFALFRR
jgi:hypothetical protein